MLLDDLSGDITIAKQLGQGRVRALLYRAKHLHIDPDAAAFVVNMVEKEARLIGELNEFALWPFETMTITLPTLTRDGKNRESLILLERHNGMNQWSLIIRDNRMRDDGAPVPIPGWYASTKHKPDEPYRTLIRIDDSIDRDNDDLMQMLGAYSLAIDAIMLLLNQKKGVHIGDAQPNRKTIRRGRNMTFFGRSEVRLELNAPIEIRRHFHTMARTTPRRHEVRGHFVHRGGAIGCEHSWERIVDRPAEAGEAWQCSRCDRKRFWRREHGRGDAAKGFVRQSYKVVA